jgi:regulator of protease activity HflC (stomatin/prohibitin superfamily)
MLLWFKLWLGGVIVLAVNLILYNYLSGGWKRAFHWVVWTLLLFSFLIGARFLVPEGRGLLFSLLYGLATLAISVGLLAMALVLMSELLVVQRGGSLKEGIKLLMAFISQDLRLPLQMSFVFTQFFRGIVVITDGEVSYTTSPTGYVRILGPFMLIINFGNVVVLDNTGTITRILRPGFYITKRFETIYAIVDMRRQEKELSLVDVFTKDYIPLEINATVFYRVRSDSYQLCSRAIYRYSEEDIRKAVLNVVDWKEATEITAESVLRDIVASYCLDDIYDPLDRLSQRGTSSPRDILQKQFQDRLNNQTKEWGVVVTEVRIGAIDVPDEVKARMLTRWEAEWRRQVRITEAEGEAEAFRLMELARAKAQMEMIIAITQGFKQMAGSGAVPGHLIALRFIEALEKMAEDPATKFLLPADVLGTLSRMRDLVDETKALPESTEGISQGGV